MKVIESFRDKLTGEYFPVGSDYESDAKRIKELQELGFLEHPPDKKEKPKG